mmetsp:Transcript_121396/g.181347  ORF Transcript_121396/g.181347 Transcript_121396/m.181347 type:complete len:351 (-) Transcript_121396:46-1098(-)
MSDAEEIIRERSATFEFITPTPIDKPDEDGERGTGYNYECDTILENFEIPIYPEPLQIAAPFSYQVAGHDPFLKAHGGLLCKPFVPRELWFYIVIKKSFEHYLPFVAEFNGCVDFSTEQIREFASAVTQFDSKESKIEKYITPWAEKVHHGHLQRIASPKSSSRRHRYLVLRDMTSQCTWPCVMDLKMGQRAYGDDATPKKMVSQTLKSKQTTSYSTGLRICGCQGYSAVTEEFWQLHKYEGRKITKETLPLAFSKFFHNDVLLRKDVIACFLEELENLLDIIKRSEFRFYSTSLLLVYDGASEEPIIYLKMIDFAHTFAAEGKPIDDGYLLGLNNVIDLFRGLLTDPDS